MGSFASISGVVLVLDFATFFCWRKAGLRRRRASRPAGSSGPRVALARKGGPSAGLTLIETLMAMSVLALLAAISLPAIQMARESARRSSCSNRLRQLGIALTAHEETHGRFPGSRGRKPDDRMETDFPMSVHLQLLPFLDERNAFDSYDTREDEKGAFAEPPGSEFNSSLLTHSIATFQCPSETARPGANSYRASTGTSPSGHTTPDVAAAEGAHAGFLSGKGRLSSDVSDGLSSTVFFSERVLGDFASAGYSPWSDTALVRGDFLTATKALASCRQVSTNTTSHFSHDGATWLFRGYAHTFYNHVAPPNSRIPDCADGHISAPTSHAARSWHNAGVNALLGDGAVRFIAEEMDLSAWRALGTIAQSEREPVP